MRLKVDLAALSDGELRMAVRAAGWLSQQGSEAAGNALVDVLRREDDLRKMVGVEAHIGSADLPLGSSEDTPAGADKERRMLMAGLVALRNGCGQAGEIVLSDFFGQLLDGVVEDRDRVRQASRAYDALNAFPELPHDPRLDRLDHWVAS